MIDWNNNGRIDPEEVPLTDIILNQGEEEDNEEYDVSRPRGGGCLTTLLLLPVYVIRSLIS